MKITKLFLLLILLFFLNGCLLLENAGEPTAVAVLPTLVPAVELPPTNTPTPIILPTTIPSATPVTPTATPTPSETPVLAIATATPASVTSTPLPTNTPVAEASLITSTIGTSYEGRPIFNYQFNNGPHQVIIVGAIHGGYEWNSAALAYELIDYINANPGFVPGTVTLHIIPNANPDGLAIVAEGPFSGSDVTLSIEETIPGRFNSREVDLNRNWDCKWQNTGLWRDQVVKAGAYPLSELENRILHDFIVGKQPEVVVFLHSAANAVYAAGCEETDRRSLELAELYGAAAGYRVFESFSAYEITGDAGDYLADIGIPNFTVELRNHIDTDWPQNLAGMGRLLVEISELEILTQP